MLTIHSRRLARLASIGALGLIAGCGVADETPAERVILITCDTLRADRLGVYGYDGETSPNLDRFARECVVFDRAYASAPLTSPALTSLMTGRVPDELGMVSNKVLAPAEAVTIAEAVSDAGIPTMAIVSNWVLRKRPGQAHMGLEQGFESYDDRMEDAEAVRTSVKERLAGNTTDAAIAWLEANDASRFFLWVHYQDPHGPYTPPEEFTREWEPGDDPELDVGRAQGGHRELPRYQALGNERHPDFYRSRYEAEIRYFDHELGRFLDALESRELLDDALVVFTADHGESLGEHDWWFTHGQTVYDELVRVPLFIRYPEGRERPSGVRRDGVMRVSSLVGHLDLFATVTDALGIPGPATRGSSLVTERIDENRIIPQNLRAPGARNRWQAVTDRRYRLIETPERVLLYDHENDPDETENLASEDPERVRAMILELEAWMSALPPVGAEAEAEDLTEEQQDELEKLGY